MVLNLFRLFFKKETECHWKLIYRKKLLDLPVGLNGIYRYNPTSAIDKIACRGRWTGSNTFIIDWQQMDSAERLHYQLNFSDNQVNILVKGVIWERNYSFKAKLAEGKKRIYELVSEKYPETVADFSGILADPAVEQTGEFEGTIQAIIAALELKEISK